MPTEVLKPIVWNTSNYIKPSGQKFSGGWAKDHGFGHEEWNNSPSMKESINGLRVNYFHTEGLGDLHSTNSDQNITIFMIASYGGTQYLVGIAGDASFIGDDNERRRIAKRLGLFQKWQDAWSQPRVRKAYGGNIIDFKQEWKDTFTWIPNWRCPSKKYVWLDTPISLDPKRINGKSKLISMHGSYQALDSSATDYIFSLVRKAKKPRDRSQRMEISKRTVQKVVTQNVENDIDKILNDRKTKKTTKKLLIDARIGQGKFRREVSKICGGACAVTGIKHSRVLRASHIWPWAECSRRARLDPHNGLLLSCNLDALFDSYLITFKRSGEIAISNELSALDRKMLALEGTRLSFRLSKYQQRYMKLHREEFDKRQS